MLKTAFISALLLLSVGSANAVDLGHGVDLSTNIGLTSDYVWRGESQTNNRPAIQGGFDLTHDSGFYLGNWNSNVDFGASALEIDLYGGYAKDFGAIGVDAGVIGYLYTNTPDDEDYYEIYGGVNSDFGLVNAGLTLYYDPENEIFYADVGTEVPFDYVTLRAHYGQEAPDVGDNRYDWSVGATTNVLTLDWSVDYAKKETEDDLVFFTVGKSF